jgi:chromosome segregation ATPase
VASLQKALERAGAQRDELSERATELTAERKQAVADVRRLTRDREYLKHRVDRMQKALSMLESVRGVGSNGLIGRE